MIRTTLILVATLAFTTVARAGEQPPDAISALERKLHGAWDGPACGGDWIYRADGTFQVQHFSPGDNQLTGTWEVRWTAIPPVLVRTCKTSDEPELVGKRWEVKLTQLNEGALGYQYPDQHPRGHTVRYTRVATQEEKELAALQGVWIPLTYEAGGKRQVPSELSTRHIIKGDHVTVQINGQTIAEGKVVLDVTKTPKHMDLQLTSGQTDLIIYIRVGDYLVYCGNRDGKTRPSEFASGTAKGGEYLLAWKIER